MKTMRQTLSLCAVVLGLVGCCGGPPVRVAQRLPSPQVQAPPEPVPEARCNLPNYQRLSCPVPPVGSLRESVQRHGRLATFWGSDCGCSGGQPQGRGEARWCAPGATEPCSVGKHYGTAFGTLRAGCFHGPVELRTDLGEYWGTLDAQGGYQSGVFRYKSGAQFIGRFNPDGSYQLGTLHQGSTILIADTWHGIHPVGTVLEGQADGSYRTLSCPRSSPCKPQKSGKSPGLADVWRAAGETALSTAGTVLRERLAVQMSLLRSQPYAFAFDTALALALHALREP